MGADSNNLANAGLTGSGLGGLNAAIQLKRAGIPFTVVEKNPDVGGTWWENRYPGARVDVGSHFYCYSFEPADHWTEYFSQQPELQAYFQGVMERHGVDDHVRWETEVTRMVWDDHRSSFWRASRRARAGSGHSRRAGPVPCCSARFT